MQPISNGIDFVAGVADLAATPADLLGLASAVVKYPFYKLNGHENAFANALSNTWGNQIGQGVRNLNSYVFHSDEESPWRKAGTDVGEFAFDLMTGPSGVAAKQAIKQARKGAYKRASKLAAKALGTTALTNTAFNAGMNYVTDGEMSPTEKMIAGASVFAVPSAMRSVRKMLRRPIAEIQNNTRLTDAQKFKLAQNKLDLKNAQSGAYDLAKLEGYNLPEQFKLHSDDALTQKEVIQQQMEQLGKIESSRINDIETVAEFESELQQRMYSRIADAGHVYNSITPADFHTGDVDKKMAQVNAALNKIGLPKVTYDTFQETIEKVNRKYLMDMFEKHPELFPEIGLADPLTGKPYSNQALLQKWKEGMSRLDTQSYGVFHNSLGKINRELLDLLHEEGLITDQSYRLQKARSRSAGYIGKASADNIPQPERNIHGAFLGGPENYAATEAEAGVMKQKNLFKVLNARINQTYKAIEENNRIKIWRDVVQKTNDRVKLNYARKILAAENALKDKTLNTFQKNELKANIEFYKQRIAQNGKFQWNVKTTAADKIANDMMSDLTVIQHMEKGKPVFDIVPKEYMQYLFGGKHRTSNSAMKAIQKTNNVAATFKSGWPNTLNFGPVKAMYAIWEGLPATMLASAKHNLGITPMKFAIEQAKQLKAAWQDGFHEWIMRKVEQKGKYLGYTRNDLDTLASKLHEDLSSPYISPLDQTGLMKRAGANFAFDAINMETASGREKLLFRTKKAFNWVSESAPANVLKVIDNGLADSTSKTITKLLSDATEGNIQKFNEIAAEISKYTSDTRRRGAGLSTLGKTLNLLQDAMPYGRSAIQGLLGKLEYFSPTENAMRVKNLLRYDTGYEKLTHLATLLADKATGDVADTLYKVVVAPTALCYFWNHMNPENATDYHELRDRVRGKNRMLINFGGRGVHAYAPVDQEWALLSSMFESMLDTTFKLSSIDPHDPKFSYATQISEAAARSLGVEFPNIVNVGTELTLGGKISITPDSVVNGVWDANYQSHSALPDGIAASLEEMTGILGQILTSSANGTFETNSLAQTPFISNDFKTKHRNDTQKWLDQQYKKDPNNPVLKEGMHRRWAQQKRLNHYQKTGLTQDGRRYNMSRKDVIDTINHNINKIDAETYRRYTGSNSSSQ